MADDPRPDQRPDQRIAKLLARAGIASRREVERMIAEGRIALDGRPLDTPATLLRSLHGVTVDGRPVAAPPPARLFLHHKPPGLLVTERDPAGRPTIYDRLPPGLPRVVPVGRLDLATEGLLLLTTDGGLKRRLELPASGVERAYRARAYGDITQARLEELIEGVEIEGVRYGPIDANLERRTGANVWIELILTEGRNREVRRVLEHLGLQVSRLIRTRYGPFVLGDLQPGEIGEVRQYDLVAFQRQLEKNQKPEHLIAVAPLTNPLRASLGEGDHAKHGGGAAEQAVVRGSPHHHRPKKAGGPPPRTSSGRIKNARSENPARSTPSPAARPRPERAAAPKRPAGPARRRPDDGELDTRPPRAPRPGARPVRPRGPGRPPKR